mmetsp:Transcript_69499/g.103475  ORF Transcript_69499/g.103475 Transcript_69499/m.103475 type:complete len:204 (-) Transcript_69499:311-922(-)
MAVAGGDGLAVDKEQAQAGGKEQAQAGDKEQAQAGGKEQAQAGDDYVLQCPQVLLHYTSGNVDQYWNLQRCNFDSSMCWTILTNRQAEQKALANYVDVFLDAFDYSTHRQAHKYPDHSIVSYLSLAGTAGRFGVDGCVSFGVGRCALAWEGVADDAVSYKPRDSHPNRLVRKIRACLWIHFHRGRMQPIRNKLFLVHCPHLDG